MTSSLALDLDHVISLLIANTLDENPPAQDKEKNSRRSTMLGGKNMKDLMKQAQRMQQEMMKSQEELENKTFEASAGGGMVTVTMSGKYHVKSIKIEPEAVDPEDLEMLEDLILAALQEAHTRVSNETEAMMGKLTGGMNIPGLI